MPTYFPQTAGGVITGLPFSSSMDFRTSVGETVSGERNSYAHRAAPLWSWNLQFPALIPGDADTLDAFFAARKGRYESFTFLDPSGNLFAFSDDFSQPDWTKTSVTVGAAQTDPFSGSLATRLTSTGSGGAITAPVLPNGSAAGIVLSMSAWVRAQSADQPLRLSFRNTGGEYAFRIVPLALNRWKRVSFGAAVSGSTAISARFGGSSSWNGTAIDFFGAQCVAMAGPGAYAKTPGHAGEFPNCRFDQDELLMEYSSAFHRSTSLRIVQHAA